MQFTQIRSATAIVNYAGVRFLIDPMLGAKGSIPALPAEICPNPPQAMPLHDLPLPVDEIVAQVDAILATHLHFDHFDEAAVKLLPHDLPVISQDAKDALQLKAWGFSEILVLTQTGIDFKGIKLTKVGAMHGEPCKIEAVYESIHMRGQACGVIFTAPNEPTFYLAGDTIYCAYVEAALDMFKPQVMAVNACGASVLNHGHIIFDVADMRKLHAYAPTVQVIATHMDNVGHATVWRPDLKALKQELNWQNLAIPADGETLVY